MSSTNLYNPKFIFTHVHSPAIQYFSVGEPPYTRPILQDGHPIIQQRIHTISNHQASITLESTQNNQQILDLIVNYKLYRSPKSNFPNPVSSDTTPLLKGVVDISFLNLIENTPYVLETDYYNPYYQDVRNQSSFSFQTSNLDTLDLTALGDQDQDRDNKISVTLNLEQHPEDISITLEDVETPDQPPLVAVNLGKKPANQEFKFQITQIPFGLYNLSLKDLNGVGLSSEFTIEKYDQGASNTTSFPGNFGSQKTVMLSIGKLSFKSQFAGNSLKNLSDLDTQQTRRARRGGAFLSTTGSFTLSSGGGAGSNRAGGIG